MTTGYTYIIEDGCTFGQFVWRCARAFGPLAHMRENTLEAVPDLEVKADVNFYDEQIAHVEKALANLEGMSDEELRSAAQADHDQAHTHLLACIAKEDKLRERYAQMREQVEAWSVPTERHERLKSFMLEQIDMCIPDADSFYKRELQRLKVEPWGAWAHRNKVSLLKSLKRYRESRAEAIDAAAKATAWLKALNESVPFEAVLEVSDD